MAHLRKDAAKLWKAYETTSEHAARYSWVVDDLNRRGLEMPAGSAFMAGYIEAHREATMAYQAWLEAMKSPE